MALIKKTELGMPRPKKDKNLIENKKNLRKLYAFITIVDYHRAEEVIRIMESIGCSMSVVQVGRGTSKNKFYDILGIKDERKAVVISIIRDDLKGEAHYVLNEYLTDAVRNKGIAFSIPLSSVVGAKVYYFLSNTTL